MEEYLGKYKWGIYVSIGVILILMCTFKTIGADADSRNYETMFYHYDDQMTTLSVEFSFRWFAEMLSYISNDVSSIFFLYAIIGIPIKLYAIKQNSDFIFIPLLVFLSHYFILHDMIEIRASVASAFLLLGTKPLSEGKKVEAAILFCCGVFFHYSMLAAFLLFFFSNKTLTKTWKWILASIVPIGYIVYFLKFDILMELPIPYIGEKVELYKGIKDLGGFDEILVFKNPLLLITILVFYLLLYYYDTVFKHKSQLPLLMKIMGTSLACFFFFSSLPVLSGRLYELYGVVNILTFSYIFYIIKPSFAAKATIAIMASIIMFMDIFVYELIKSA